MKIEQLGNGLIAGGSTQLFSLWANTDSMHEALFWPHIKEAAEGGINPLDHLLCVL